MRTLSAVLLLFSCALIAQTNTDVVKPGDNLVIENIPPIPTAIAEEAHRYSESRFAFLMGWHPQRREMLIGTRFAEVPQVHWVKMPGGARQQMTFFPDHVVGADFPGKQSDFFVFQKDVGGGEWFQLYRFDVASGNITLLTDGKSRNTGPVYEHEGTHVIWSSTRRNNKDTDLWMMDTRDPATARMVLQVEGGGWAASD
ncbi:MAG: S9 family peptidase, partial [Acidobacteriales bacterium]|nr:S9 family peptidase [Terriglobales bacterium]